MLYILNADTSSITFYLLRAKNRGYEYPEVDNFAYDVFVAYNSLDRVWVISEMIPILENKENLILCLHDGDFQVGKLTVDNITNAMHRSKKILNILTVSPKRIGVGWKP